MPINPLIGAALIGGATGGIGGYFGSKAQEATRKRELDWEREKMGREDKRRSMARGAVSDYSYTPYGQTYQPFSVGSYVSQNQGAQSGVINELLSGKIDPATMALIKKTMGEGITDISTRAAGQRMVSGGQQALQHGLMENIGMKMAAESMSRKKAGLQYGLPYEQFQAGQFARKQDIERGERRTAFDYGLADYLREQETGLKRQELLASYS